MKPSIITALLLLTTIACSYIDKYVNNNGEIQHIVSTDVLHNDDYSFDLNEPVYLINLVEGTIDGVNLRGSIESIFESIEKERVLEETEYLEGEPHTVYLISFGDSIIYKHWNALSFIDPKFKLENGLTVGSTFGDFKKVFGKGEEVYGEGGLSLSFRNESPTYGFSLIPLYANGKAKIGDNDLVKEIWIW